MVGVLSSSFITIASVSTNANQLRIGNAQLVSVQKMEAEIVINTAAPTGALAVVNGVNAVNAVNAINNAISSITIMIHIQQQERQQERQQQQQQEQQGYGGRSGNPSFNPDRNYLDYRLSTLQ